MSDYTPTTEEVKESYQGGMIEVGPNTYEIVDEEQAKAEFDRWVAEIKAEAWEEGWAAGLQDRNPYRQR